MLLHVLKSCENVWICYPYCSHTCPLWTVAASNSIFRSPSASTIRSVKTDRLKEIMYNLDVVPQHPAMTSKSIDLIGMCCLC